MSMDGFSMSRRAALAGMAAMPLIGCTGMGGGLAAPASSVPSPLNNPATPSLNALAMRGGRRFGSAIASTPGFSAAGSIQNPAYTEIVKAECGIVVPENEMKWQAVRPSPDRFDLTNRF